MAKFKVRNVKGKMLHLAKQPSGNSVQVTDVTGGMPPLGAMLDGSISGDSISMTDSNGKKYRGTVVQN